MFRQAMDVKFAGSNFGPDLGISIISSFGNPLCVSGFSDVRPFFIKQYSAVATFVKVFYQYACKPSGPWDFHGLILRSTFYHSSAVRRAWRSPFSLFICCISCVHASSCWLWLTLFFSPTIFFQKRLIRCTSGASFVPCSSMLRSKALTGVFRTRVRLSSAFFSSTHDRSS